MSDNPFLSTLGLAARARRLVSGEEAVIRAIQNGSAKLVVLARDVGPNTEKTMRDKCRHYGVMVIVGPDRETLGRAVGKEARVVLAVTEMGFARRIAEHHERTYGKGREAP
ncbi:MAG: ribosomal L7Ae/L30e/S12e/Gadd45 family protein [Hydrogenibacillus sp.]|nr:ribosomal L7Ae/L30e/S12e/Gadd45 family protein [Hydrogenibacillus sp.]